MHLVALMYAVCRVWDGCILHTRDDYIPHMYPFLYVALHTHTRTHAHTHTYVYVYVGCEMATYTHAHTHTYVYVYTYMYAQTYLYVCTYLYTCVRWLHTHTHTHAHPHTYVYVYTHTSMNTQISGARAQRLPPPQPRQRTRPAMDDVDGCWRVSRSLCWSFPLHPHRLSSLSKCFLSQYVLQAAETHRMPCLVFCEFLSAKCSRRSSGLAKL